MSCYKIEQDGLWEFEWYLNQTFKIKKGSSALIPVQQAHDRLSLFGNIVNFMDKYNITRIEVKKEG